MDFIIIVISLSQIGKYIKLSYYISFSYSLYYKIKSFLSFTFIFFY
jgi:hypothetical protein